MRQIPDCPNFSKETTILIFIDFQNQIYQGLHVGFLESRGQLKASHFWRKIGMNHERLLSVGQNNESLKTAKSAIKVPSNTQSHKLNILQVQCFHQGLFQKIRIC